ncbi:MAG TPA: MFS transporter [Polyangiaceae bacterium]|nr:MFS transporter [Polyangiaceae bacterium]
MSAADAVAAPPPVRKREIFGWAMFDFANSSYTTVVITAVYAEFFTEHVVPAGAARDSYWSLAIVLSTVLALGLSPLVGAICDKSGRKKVYLLGTTAACSLATAALALVGPGDLGAGVALVALSNAAFMLSESFCASFLPELATEKTMGKISGLGWGLGYFGGLASLLLVGSIVGGEGPGEVGRTQRAMVVTALFFTASSLPTLLLVRERGRPAPGFEGAGLGRLLRAGLGELKQTAGLARQHWVLFRFLLAFMVYMAGLEAVIKFVGIYARSELQFGMGDLQTLFVILQFSAAGGAFAFGLVEARIGAKPTVLATLGLWFVAVMAIYGLGALSAAAGVEPKRLFFAVALLAGTGIGATQSSSRTVVGLLAPPERSAQIFGFWGMFSRLGTILGMSFGVAADLLHSRRTALLLVASFFVAGAVLLWPIPIDRPSRARA